MRHQTDTDTRSDNMATHNSPKYSKFKTLAVNINGLNNFSKTQKNSLKKMFDFLKTNKIDVALLQEIHSTKVTEKQWQKEWTGISFWNSGPTNSTVGVAILFNEKFHEKIQNIKNDDVGRI